MKQLIGHVRVGSGGAASIQFTNIPQDGTHLLIQSSLRTSVAGSFGGEGVSAYFNGNTTKIQSINLAGYSSSVETGSDTANSGLLSANHANNTSGVFASGTALINNYSSSTAHKRINVDGVTENNTSSAYFVFTTIYTMIWPNNAAITSMVLTPFSATSFVQDSFVSLYKITAATPS